MFKVEKLTTVCLQSHRVDATYKVSEIAGFVRAVANIHKYST